MLPDLNQIVDRDRELALVARVRRRAGVLGSIVVLLRNIADSGEDDPSGGVSLGVGALNDDVAWATGVVDEEG